MKQVMILFMSAFLLSCERQSETRAANQEKIKSALTDVYIAANNIEWYRAIADKKDASLADAADYAQALRELENSVKKAEALRILDIDIDISRSDGEEAGQKRTEAFWDQYK